MKTFPTRTAVVLSGGGAYGAFSVGILKVLFAGRSPSTNYHPLQTDIFTGTSVGAFNAGLMLSHPQESSLDTALRLERFWFERIADRPNQCENGIFRIRCNPLDYTDPSCLATPSVVASRLVNDSLNIGGYILGRAASFLASSSPLESRLIQLVNIGSFVDSTPYHDLMHEVISEEFIRNSKKILIITTTNWVNGQVVYFRNSDFHDDLGIHAILASTAIPGVFSTVTIGNGMYVDGGVVENTPLSPALNAGATELHVIYLNPLPQFIPLLSQPNTLDTLLRVYHLMLATKLNEDIETARWINAGLATIGKLKKSGEFSAAQTRDVVRVANKILGSSIEYKPLTIHRYFPAAVLGGEMGALDFGVESIARMIAEGERVALLHNCGENNCVLPDATTN